GGGRGWVGGRGLRAGRVRPARGAPRSRGRGVLRPAPSAAPIAVQEADDMTPDAAATCMAEIAYLLRHKGDTHRARAFTRVAGLLLRDRPDLDALRAAGRLETLEGVGAGIARTLGELVDTGTSSYLDRLRDELSLPDLGAPRFEVSPLIEMGYRGDLHAHTDWSDGHATVMEMALAAKARGYEYLAITDHSPRIPVVNGLGPERLA